MSLVATPHNVDELEKCIPFAYLAKNYQNAIRVTRRLGVRYLWIDAICILQGQGGDFETESRLMEGYYSGAYCTIAVHCSHGGPSDGFLKPRPSAGDRARTSQAFRRGKSKFYICSAIDNFSRDVEESHLSSRGWVFQERALSVRTIYFTETQAYFECGNGIRCETMTKPYNPRAPFLSDPSFPQGAMDCFAHAYSKYSTLGFSPGFEEDRAVAMYGLERRLLNARSIRGRYGAVDGGFLHESLLWRRKVLDDNVLREIKLNRHPQVPS
ncbi:heterokaryon incompatibility protein-domain-containing protein [Xylaria acuta]|nr:heterokaryon incompatibility protein-domain-containing protein [Xylaria acuta]